MIPGRTKSTLRSLKMPKNRGGYLIGVDGAPSGGRTHTGRILSPPRETPGFQNCGILSVTQARVLGILGIVYQLCMSS